MLLSICCLILVIAVTMGYTTLVIGHLNIITIHIRRDDSGPGRRSGVQFISRYEEELTRDRNRFDAVRGALNSTGPASSLPVSPTPRFFAMCSAVQGRGRIGHYRGRWMLLATLG